MALAGRLRLDASGERQKERGAEDPPLHENKGIEIWDDEYDR